MTLQFRPAVVQDSDLLADLVAGTPDQEITRVAMRLYGIKDFETARALYRIVWRSSANWEKSFIAEVDGEPVGMVQAGGSSMRISIGLVLGAARRLPPAVLLRMPRRLKVRARVMPHMPPDAYTIAEIHVAPHRRNEGLGRPLIEMAEQEARARGHTTIALITLTTNPARHFYLRAGYQVAQERTDPEFLRITGAAGHVLMVKDIGPAT